MSIDEAIKRLGKLRLPIKTEEDHKDHEAVSFGIEALKMVMVHRISDLCLEDTLLPDENEAPLKIRGARGVMIQDFSERVT